MVKNTRPNCTIYKKHILNILNIKTVDRTNNLKISEDI